MPSKRSFGANAFVYAGGSAVSLAAGILLTVTSVRDFLLYLDSYDLGMVGTTNGLLGVILLGLVGSLLIVGALWGTIVLAVNESID